MVVPNMHLYNFTLTNIPSSMRSLGVFLGDIYQLHVAIFAYLPKRPLEAKILFKSQMFDQFLLKFWLTFVLCTHWAVGSL